MKRIVSVSLGSSSRNHSVVARIGDEEFLIERIGTDGSYEKAVNLIRELDGKIDAFGMGGISLYIYGKNNRRYILKSALPILKEAKKTPMADGSGLKNTLERHVVRFLKEELGIPLEEMTVLMVCGMERLGMAETFSQMGCKTIYGDIMFVLGIPLAIRSLSGLHRVAAALMPIVRRLPLKLLYPSGQNQDINTPKFEKYFNEADIIAGDYLYIKKYMPLSLDGKIIVTNTVTPKDVEILRERGAKLLVTSTPELEGRSFGTNVMEALASVLIGKRPEDITPNEYQEVLDQGFFRHRVVYF
ncbi:MAG TPA: quinate 5-dehydrogenase [Clostridiales bacterium]|nr:quinate 5-dehydrogenase [Clostridiales bacterium]